jgi:hypothetical protein
MKISLLLKSLKWEFHKKSSFSPTVPLFPHFSSKRKPTLWEKIGHGPESGRGFAGMTTPQKEPIWQPLAHSAKKSPHPANPPQCRKLAKGVGPIAWWQRCFEKEGKRVEPLGSGRGDELVEDQNKFFSF